MLKLLILFAFKVLLNSTEFEEYVQDFIICANTCYL